ncbi:GNAT family N-acetyltransferase [Cellulosimicrobium cellulans]|uniref:GNAT family N-acetyltransferase n=1 Tax=Cellulosimicrobium cellulans TaxID=1710 RepID=UPI001112F89F|nr:GNAT family N-acetyltransferase [Cellulosimicrobium cellulans]
MVWTDRVLPVASSHAVDHTAWAALGERAADPNPYFEPSFLVPAARHLDRAGSLRLLVVEDAGRWQAVLPFEHAPGHRSLRGRTSTGGPLLGFVSPCGTPLVDLDASERAADRLVEALLARGRELGRLVDLANVDVGTRTGRSLLGALERRGVPRRTWDHLSRGALDSTDDAPVDVLAALSRSRRRSLQRSRRHLEHELGGPLEVAWATDADAVERFLELQAAGWKGTPGRGGKALLLHRGTAAWFRDLAEAAAPHLRVLEVRCGGELLYSGVTLVRDDRAFFVLDAYDERWSRWSVGSWGQLLMMAEMTREGLSLDSCTDPREYPLNTALYPDRRELRSMTCAVGTRAERALFAGADRVLDARRAFLARARDLTSRAVSALHAALLPVVNELPCVAVVI